MIKREGNYIIIEGNFLEYYNSNDDILECPYIKFEGLKIESIDEDSIYLDITDDNYHIELLDGIGNVTEEYNLQVHIKQEIDKYINLTDEQKEVLFKIALADIQDVQKNYNPNIEGIIYELATNIEEYI